MYAGWQSVASKDDARVINSKVGRRDHYAIAFVSSIFARAAQPRQLLISQWDAESSYFEIQRKL